MRGPEGAPVQQCTGATRPFDDPRVSPVPALRVEVLLAADVSPNRCEDVLALLRGKGRRADGPADDADGAGELTRWGSMSASVAARQISALMA